MNNVLNDHFDHIYVLYISDIELHRAKQKLLKANITAEFYKGINGKTELDSSYKSYVETRTKTNQRIGLVTHGMFGHVHSFMNILRDALYNEYNKILILEPDIYFSNDFYKKFDTYKNIDYKILYLGASQKHWDNINISQATQNGYYNAHLTYGTFAIGLDKSVFQQYLSILGKYNSPSDVAICEIQDQNIGQCIVTYPNIIQCDLTSSSTGGASKSQKEIMNTFKWQNICDIFDNYKFIVKPNIIQKIVFHINYAPNGQCSIRTSVPASPIINLYKIDTPQTYTLYLLPSKEDLYIDTYSMYVNRIDISEFCLPNTKNCDLLKSTLTRFIQSKNLSLSNYYIRLLSICNISPKVTQTENTKKEQLNKKQNTQPQKSIVIDIDKGIHNITPIHSDNLIPMSQIITKNQPVLINIPKSSSLQNTKKTIPIEIKTRSNRAIDIVKN